jgi:hypothetical protein
MNLLVVYDNDGQIQALVKGRPHGRMSSGVKPQANQHVREMEVPAGMETAKLSSLHATLRVDRSGREPRLVKAG